MSFSNWSNLLFHEMRFSSEASSFQAKMQSKEQCLLKDGTEDEKDQLEEFVKYFLRVPGYNRGDLDGQTLSLPDHCQEYLKTLGGVSMSEVLSSSARFQQLMLSNRVWGA